MFIRSMAVLSIALVAVACGKSDLSSSEVKTVTGPKGPITNACQIQKHVAFKCDTVDGYKVEIVVDNGTVSVNGRPAAQYKVTKFVQNGEVNYSFFKEDANEDDLVTISTGKNGKGFGSTSVSHLRGMHACKFSALRDTRVLDFLVQDNGICHPR